MSGIIKKESEIRGAIYFVSDNKGRFTYPLTFIQAAGIFLAETLRFGEMIHLEDEAGRLCYERTWFEDQPKRLRRSTK